MRLTVAQLAKRLGAELIGQHRGANGLDRYISSVAAVEAACENDVTFITDDRHAAALKKSRAGAVIVAAALEGASPPQLMVRNVDAALIEALNIFAPQLKRPAEGIDPSAKIGQNVSIDKSATIGPFVVIDDEVKIGLNSVIGSGCKIGQNCIIGDNCRLDSNVVVYHNCRLGNNVIIQANSTIGSVGFGYSFIDGKHKLVPHNGGVIIENFVEIGANCCVDRAKFGNTIIGAGTKIDNLVQIAHNVVIGKCCLIAGQTGISGSSKLGNGVVLGGQVGVTDNIEIGDGVMVGGKSGILNNVAAGQQLLGMPAVDRKESLRITALVGRLPRLVEQIKQLIKRVDKIEAAKDHKS
jgi:UDP-3-O-[3-hydroxymyristoyl] glucosamine N-acyltransferase